MAKLVLARDEVGLNVMEMDDVLIILKSAWVRGSFSSDRIIITDDLHDCGRLKSEGNCDCEICKRE